MPIDPHAALDQHCLHIQRDLALIGCVRDHLAQIGEVHVAVFGQRHAQCHELGDARTVIDNVTQHAAIVGFEADKLQITLCLP